MNKNDILPCVLIIENNIPTIELYQRELMDSYQVIPCDDDVEALQLLSTKNIQVVILEPACLGADGWRFLAKLKTDLVRKTIPVIICTTQDDCYRAQEFGADVCLIKPILPSELRNYLARFVSE